MKKTFAAVVTCLALIASPAFAQSPAPVDPAAAAAVKQMLASMRYREVMASTFQQMQQGMPEQIRTMLTSAIGADPNLSAEKKKQAMGEVEKAVPVVMAGVRSLLADPALIDELIAETVPLYARTFSIAEIRQLAAFYATPLGQKMLATMPKLMGESMEISNRIIAPRMNNVMQQMMQHIANQK